MNEQTKYPETKQITPDALDNYRLNFYGNKKKLLPQIAEAIPEGTRTVADLMGGSGIVSWYLKHQGYRMISNDIMRYPCIRMKALVANQSTVLTAADVEMLCRKTQGKEENRFMTFYRRTFGEKNCRFLHSWASNIPKLKDPIKRDIAVYIPIVCISKYFKYAAIHWSALGLPIGGRNLPGVDLERDVRQYAIHTFPNFLWDNGQENAVHNRDAVELVSKIDADVLYIDPPYATGTKAEYEANYAILDDLVSILSGKGNTIVSPMDSKCELAPYTFFGTRTSAIVGLSKLFERSEHIPTLIISYNSSSRVSPKEIVTLARAYGRDVPDPEPFAAALPRIDKIRPKTTTEYLICCYARSAQARRPAA